MALTEVLIKREQGPMDAHGITVKVPFFPGNLEKVSGSEVIDLTPESLPDNITASHKIQVHVHLYKLRP